MENPDFDTVIVGAGPAGIAAASTMQSAPGRGVLIVDGGRSHRARLCPVDEGKHCNGCKRKCNVISGFGGALHFGDAAKFSLLPSGRRLIELFGMERALALCDDAVRMLQEFGSLPVQATQLYEKQVVSDLFRSHDLRIRDYPVITASEAVVKRIIGGAFVAITKRHTLALRENFVDVSRVGDTFAVTTSRRRVTSKSVVLATGRSGVTATQRILKTLNVPLNPPKPSIGVRFELPAALVQGVGKVYPDLKVSVQGPAGEKTKTFCFSAGEGGGKIKFCHYQDAFDFPYVLLDGHTVVDRKSKLGVPPANFAVMHQLSERSGYTEDWLGPMLLDKYQKLSSGRPMVQSYADFRNAQQREMSWEQIRRELRFQPSIEDLVAGPLFLLYDPHVRQQICSTFERLLECCVQHAAGSVSLVEALANTIAVGPELEFFWDEVGINDQCQTPIPGLYVVGDAAGLAQGNLQAMMMGIAASNSLNLELPQSEEQKSVLAGYCT